MMPVISSAHTGTLHVASSPVTHTHNTVAKAKKTAQPQRPAPLAQQPGARIGGRGQSLRRHVGVLADGVDTALQRRTPLARDESRLVGFHRHRDVRLLLSETVARARVCSPAWRAWPGLRSPRTRQCTHHASTRGSARAGSGRPSARWPAAPRASGPRPSSGPARPSPARWRSGARSCRAPRRGWGCCPGRRARTSTAARRRPAPASWPARAGRAAWCARPAWSAACIAFCSTAFLACSAACSAWSCRALRSSTLCSAATSWVANASRALLVLGGLGGVTVGAPPGRPARAPGGTMTCSFSTSPICRVSLISS